ncbi:MAG: aldose 1-epimerase family protein [Hyphomicrobiales bacterium]|nr:aldose 1-epimerase family protein [Hyphomicrobiales bacterium]
MLTLERDGAKLAVARLGAEARAWSVGGRELLWPSDPTIWGQISPILYPVVGWTRDGARVNGRHYPLGLHGFAAAQDFTIEAAGADFARLTLADAAATRALYPFAFRLTVEYRLSADALAIAVEVENPGPERAPYACGLHPGFRWPFGGGPRDGARVRFEKPEAAQIPVMVPGGLIGAAKRTIPLEGGDLPLSDELFANDALCFLNPASRSLRFEEASGAAIEMDFHGFDHAALWTRPHAPFLCLEAWTGYSDPEGFAGDLFEKPSMRVLEPGQNARHEARYRYFEGRSEP